jgi:integrase
VHEPWAPPLKCLLATARRESPEARSRSISFRSSPTHTVQFLPILLTSEGRRSVSLDAVTLSALREHRTQQNAERLAMGSGWAGLDLIFCRVDGTPLHPERFSRQFAVRVRQLRLPKIRLHDLRHGWATMALSTGVHAKVVQERLGHANIGITLDTYSHIVAGLHSDAAEKVAGLVFGS